MEIKESAENYLEAILMISKKQNEVKASDICSFFGYSRPTVSVALKQFRENGYINVDNKNTITLTEKGYKIAVNILERHNIITQFFLLIGVNQTQAIQDACLVEHDISNETFQCMKEHIKTMIESN